MEHSLPGSTVSKKCETNIVSTLIFFGKCKSCTCSNLRTNYTMTAKKFHIFTKKVHTSALSFCTTCCFSIKFAIQVFALTPFAIASP